MHLLLNIYWRDIVKRVIGALIFVCCFSGLFARETGSDNLPIQLDLTGFISYGLYEDSSDSDLDGLNLFFKSLRGGATAIVRYEFLPAISAGIESGFGYVSYDESNYFLDIPLNIIGRVGIDLIFLEGHVGYYFSSFSDLSGVSTGAKVGLGDWFFDASVILGDKTYTRYTFGYQISSLL